MIHNLFLAAGEGFEPSQTESESVVLPLHNPAVPMLYGWLAMFFRICLYFLLALFLIIYCAYRNVNLILWTQYAYMNAIRLHERNTHTPGASHFLPGFLLKPSHWAPEDFRTAIDGSSADLKPNSLQDLGCLGSHVIAKWTQWKQSILSCCSLSIKSSHVLRQNLKAQIPKVQTIKVQTLKAQLDFRSDFIQFRETRQAVVERAPVIALDQR